MCALALIRLQIAHLRELNKTRPVNSYINHSKTMTDDIIYQYTKSRKQQSKLYIRMGVFCWVYVAGLYAYEFYSGQTVQEDFRLAILIAFPVSSLLLFLVAWWHVSHSAIYEAIITREKFTVNYPDHSPWSFNVNVQDIKRFENRQELSHAGKGIMQHGILLKDGRFFHISMNYGNSIKDMYKAIKSINKEVTFSSKVNKKAHGPGINRDYES
ncbi:MAG: hypothetical protein DIZ80_16740 [endosymbiont of Galathealinum brachiosum]|uniref:Uncharacterized protein n=1 Tax=endosymbiont of Galathealinum brachiosum TaxID=2200906 RepID=A0A370D906_9GAMM|nr:MAG: hypothetical protein DIZ80_16740 [endosymbiont of Galathealinum brachiosum]